ncbi:MAG: tetratricopeptide repeat protein, partial [Bacteroidota bacterium]
MHRKFWLAAIFFILLNVSGQADPVIDSLLNLLQQHTTADTVRVNLLNELGVEYWIVAPSESEYYGQQALVLADSLSYVSGIAYAYDVIGVAHWTQGKYTTALDYLISALTSYQRLGYTIYAANTMLNIGLIYYEQQDYELALQFFKEGLKKHEQQPHPDVAVMANAYSNIGSVYFNLGDHARADSSFTQALNIYQDYQLHYGISASYINLGDLRAATVDYARALSYYQKSLDISRQLGDNDGVAAILYRIGKTYRQQQKYSPAEQYLTESIEVAQQVNDQKQLQDIYLELKELENAKGNFQQAISHYEQYVAIKDSLFNEEKSRQIAELQTVYETQQKEQEIALQNERIQTLREKARTDSILRYGLIFCVLVL